MKKKLFAMLLTAALVAAQGVTAFAAVSPSTSEPIKDASGNDVVISGNTEVVITKVNTEEAVSSLSQSVKETVKGQLQAAAGGNADTIISSMGEVERTALSGATMVSGAFFNVTTQDKTITLRMPTIPANKSVYALHLTAGGKWELIPASRNGEYITLTSAGGWSPVVIVAKDPAEAPAVDTRTTTWEEREGQRNRHGARPSESTGVDGVLVTSPKTGVASDWGLWVGGAVALLAAASVMLRKKEA